MKKIVYLIVFLTIPLLTDAQRWKHERLSAYAAIGTNLFLGDLGGGMGDGSHYFSFKDIDWVTTRPTASIGISYRILQDLTIKPAISFARLKADDAESENYTRKARNLHFRSNVWELGAQFEYFFIREKYLGRYTFSSYKGTNKFSAYVSLGGGAFYFNPQSETVRGANDWTGLKSMENEGVSYSNFAAYLSLGLGMKYKLTTRWAIGLEATHRYTTTDYLDDAHDTYSGKGNGFDDRHLVTVVEGNTHKVTDQLASPYPAGKKLRGNPKYNDAYFFMLITGYYKINSTFSMPKY